MKVYSFRLGKGDEDIEQLLKGLARNERSQYIKNALRFYRDFGEKISKIEAMLEKIEASGFYPPGPREEAEPEQAGYDTAEKMLIESLENILSF
ncbi:hypothetical protein [Thermosediminibacter oceani]|uniref:Uncharacterized protein n=1 Tax=Thermosediminibacter oceani (strain ATCC BAA-1034 / DSM 16646 / JW/IW-1228P) TaxID=555079 RepID=D9S1C4_THEOJ|nr:hypothetical protein [Thermosediminibacter oceani]ADL07201.1 conserved hypothetical protein [Thermosediminibacter oceani DSM 16646]